MEGEKKSRSAYQVAWHKRRMAEDPDYRERFKAQRREYERKYYADHREAERAYMVRCWANKLRRMGYTVIEPEGGAK